MRLSNKIRQWATDRDLHNADPVYQLAKLTEEVGELSSAITRRNIGEQIDAIGDINVVMEILCMQLKLDYEDCKHIAYDEIKDRKGKTVNGTFIKESDLN